MSYRPDFIMAPTPNDTTVRAGRAHTAVHTVVFNATTASQSHALPKSFNGQYVRVKAQGGTVHFFFAEDDSQEVDATVAGTAAGATGATVAWYLATGEFEDMQLPGTPDTGTIYFVREADVSCEVSIRRA